MEVISKNVVASSTMSSITQKSSTCLGGLRQKPTEYPSSFMDHFNEEMSQIKDLTPLEALHILVFGLKIEPFTISLVRLPSEKINELQKRVRYYIIMEEIIVAK